MLFWDTPEAPHSKGQTARVTQRTPHHFFQPWHPELDSAHRSFTPGMPWTPITNMGIYSPSSQLQNGYYVPSIVLSGIDKQA